MLETFLATGQPHLAFETLDSTSSYLKSWVRDRERQAPAAGTVVSARVQTSGYGQHGRIWTSTPGRALTFSIWLPGPPVALLTMRAGVGIAESLDTLMRQPIVRLKWVNDIVVGGRKLGGILAEGILGGPPERQGSVLGIGVNLEPPDSIPHATGLWEILETAEDSVDNPEQLGRPAFGQILESMVSHLSDWLEPARDPVSVFRARAASLGERVILETPTREIVEGLAEDIDDQGHLLIRLDDGGLRRCHSGTLRLANGRYA